MGDRVYLHGVLESVIGNSNVYFQPPETLKLSYPCIIYSRSSIDKKAANNGLYTHKMGYTLTIVDRAPDNSELLVNVLGLPTCSFVTNYKSDNLYHDVFKIYF